MSGPVYMSLAGVALATTTVALAATDNIGFSAISAAAATTTLLFACMLDLVLTNRTLAADIAWCRLRLEAIGRLNTLSTQVSDLTQESQGVTLTRSTGVEGAVRTV